MQIDVILSATIQIQELNAYPDLCLRHDCRRVSEIVRRNDDISWGCSSDPLNFEVVKSSLVSFAVSDDNYDSFTNFQCESNVFILPK